MRYNESKLLYTHLNFIEIGSQEASLPPHRPWAISENLGQTSLQHKDNCVVDMILTHWGRQTHICVSKLTIIASDNGLSPGRRQAIIWPSAGILLIGNLRNPGKCGVDAVKWYKIRININTFLQIIAARKESLNCYYSLLLWLGPWWRHQMGAFSALLALCAVNSLVPGEFPAQRPVTWSFDVSFDLRPNKRLGKQSWGWWLETPPHSLWRHRNA